MNRPLLAVLAATFLWGWAVESYAQRGDESRAAVPQMYSKRDREGHQHRRHRVAPIVVFAPEFVAPGSAQYPYLSLPYVDEDPPTDAYQELDGFFYYCANLRGYYPQVQDCPYGWYLVAP